MPEDKTPTRRTFLGAGAATPVLISAIQPAALALAQGVQSTLKTVMDLMIPASDGMPSASEAGGLRYLESSLRRLLKRATCGLSFPTSAGHMMESFLPGLLSSSSRDRLRAALDVLTDLAEMEAVALATPQKSARITVDESAQLKRILDLLHERFSEPIRMRDLCAAGNMSERSLHRLFVRHLGENMTDYLGRLRIGRACMWLVETDRPVSLIATDAGFSKLSNFNRRFRAVRQMTPKEISALLPEARAHARVGLPGPDEAFAVFGSSETGQPYTEADPKLSCQSERCVNVYSMLFSGGFKRRRVFRRYFGRPTDDEIRATRTWRRSPTRRVFCADCSLPSKIRE